MSTFIIFVCVLLTLSNSLSQASVGGYIGPKDITKFKTTLSKITLKETEDVLLPYYIAKGLKLLDEPVNKALSQEACTHLKAQYKPDKGAEATFHVISAWSLLACPGKLHTEATLKSLRDILENTKSTIADIRYAAETLSLLGQNIPNGAKVAQLIQSKLKEDDSLSNLGQALHTAALLGSAGKFAQDRIEDVVVQADEVDGKLLQWEGGLSVTSLLITGLLRLPSANPLTAVQAEKLANYLLTRRTVQTPKGIVALLEATNALAASKVSPVSITVVGAAQVTVDQPELKIKVSDVFGRALKPAPMPVVAQSATRIVDDVVVLAKQPLSTGSTATEFVLPLKLEPGVYRLALMAGSYSTSVNVRVLGPVTVQNFEIGLSDADGSSAPKLTKLIHNNKIKLQADSSQHLIVKFSLSRLVHQAFLRLYSGNKEIIFVAESDTSRNYKLDINLATEISLSGLFDLELILGDSVIINPIRWNLGSIDVNLGQLETAQKIIRGPKPEIKHLFRPAEKRPAAAVSLFFTAFTAAPLLLLIGLWAKIGINFKNFTTKAIPFHLSFGGILVLFTLFWLKLDMFTTCACLVPVGLLTFISGYSLLADIVKNKKPEKSEK